MPTIKQQKEERAGLVVKMRSLLDTASKAGRQLTAEENQEYERMEAKVDEIGHSVDREERLAVVETELRNRKDHDYRPGARAAAATGDKRRNSEEYRKAFADGRQSFARVGKNGLSPDFVNVLSEGVDVDGGYLVPEEFETRVIEQLVNADPIRAAATVITTRSDRNIPIETDSGSFAFIGENADYPVSDPKFGKVVLGAHKNGGIIKVSEELLQDEFFGLEAYIQRLSARRWNAIEQTNFANGNGIGAPLGLFQTTEVGSVAVTGKTGAVSASAAITADDLVDTFHTLARAYRDNAVWITSDTMIKMIRKLKTGVSGDNTYLWQPGLVAGQPDRLLNRPIMVSDGAPAPAVSGKSIVFGDLSYYYIVDRLGMSMQRLSELYAAQGQVGFRMSKRTDARMTSAKAMTYFQHGAGA